MTHMQGAEPLISVIMSVFNGAGFLREAVDSIRDQSFRDFEFIVINDGSTDGSAAILDGYRRRDARVRVIHQENKGLVAALNRGCALARGRYIARMDADDVAVGNRLLWQMTFMEAHPEVGVLGGAVDVIDIDHNMIKEYCANPETDREIRNVMLDTCPFWHPTVFMRREIFRQLGGYRDNVFGAEDYDLWLRAADHCGLANLKAVLLHYRLHPSQVTVSKIRQLAFSTLAVQAAAKARSAGRPDPLDGGVEVTPSLLVALGVDEVKQQAALAERYLWSIGTLCAQQQHGVAFNVFSDMLLSCKWTAACKRTTADLRLLAGQLYWRRGMFLKGIASATYAALTRPVILGRPVKPMLRWLRLQTARW